MNKRIAKKITKNPDMYRQHQLAKATTIIGRSIRKRAKANV